MRMKMKNKIAGIAAFMLSAVLMPAVTAFAEETTPVTTDISTPPDFSVESATVTLELPEGIENIIDTGSSETDSDNTEVKQPSGNGHLLEDVLDGEINRQFLTIQVTIHGLASNPNSANELHHSQKW